MSTPSEAAKNTSHAPEDRCTYRAWYAEFGAARDSAGPLEELVTFREWYAHFDAGKWDRQFESDAAAGRLEWLAAEARNDFHEGRCTDR